MSILRVVQQDISRLVEEIEDAGFSSRSMPLETAIKHIQKHCKQSYEQYLNGNVIYRGSAADEPALYGDPSTQYRRSSGSDSGDLLNYVIDTSPYWSNFPKRSRSFMMSMDIGTADHYGGRRLGGYRSEGNVYVCFPHDGAKLGASYLDVVQYRAVDDSNQQLDKLFYAVGIFADKIVRKYFKDEWQKLRDNPLYKDYRSDGMIESMKLDLTCVDKLKSRTSPKEMAAMIHDLAKEGYTSDYDVAFLLRYSTSNLTLLESMHEVCRPETQGSVVVSLNQLDSVKDTYEVWTGSPCVMINLGYIKEFGLPNAGINELDAYFAGEDRENDDEEGEEDW